MTPNNSILMTWQSEKTEITMNGRDETAGRESKKRFPALVLPCDADYFLSAVNRYTVSDVYACPFSQMIDGKWV